MLALLLLLPVPAPPSPEALPGVHRRPIGWAKGEPFYKGRPASYYSQWLHRHAGRGDLEAWARTLVGDGFADPVTRAVAAVLAVASCGQAINAAPAPVPVGSADQYVFVLDTDRLVVVERDGWSLVGTLTKDGDFVESVRYPLGHLLSGPYYYINKMGTQPVAYEYRSGRLVKGELKRDGVFVPEVGSAVIDFKDFRYRPGGPPVWNLPGRFVRKDELSSDWRWK